jgi:hypothetical protein
MVAIFQTLWARISHVNAAFDKVTGATLSHYRWLAFNESILCIRRTHPSATHPVTHPQSLAAHLHFGISFPHHFSLTFLDDHLKILIHNLKSRADHFKMKH